MTVLRAAELLWTSDEPLDAARQTTVRRLVTVVETLRRDHPLGGGEDEFLALHAPMSAGDEDALGDVWSDPRAYFWTLVAEDLTNLVAGTGAPSATTTAYCDALGLGLPSEALAFHLEQFKAFALGFALHANRDLQFAAPFRPRLPLGIPGTGSALLGPPASSIAGVGGGRLDAPADLELEDCPVARHGSYELRLDVHALDAPGWDKAETARQAGRAFQAQHVGLVEQALGAIGRYAPDVFDQFPRVMRAAALKPLEWGGFDDFSNPELPGSFIASVVHHPLELGDHLVHEFQHNRLSLIEENGELFTSDPAVEGYYSPWRAKPRGLYGVFHGVYVFLALCGYWSNVYADPDVRGIDHTYALDRVLRYPQQLALAIGMLRQRAQLTPLGAALLDEFAGDLEAVRRDLGGRAELPADAPAFVVLEDGECVPECSLVDGRRLTVGASIREHLELYDVEHHCVGVLD